jgi:hypothetical protein
MLPLLSVTTAVVMSSTCTTRGAFMTRASTTHWRVTRRTMVRPAHQRRHLALLLGLLLLLQQQQRTVAAAMVVVAAAAAAAVAVAAAAAAAAAKSVATMMWTVLQGVSAVVMVQPSIYAHVAAASWLAALPSLQQRP